ncbi:MAG: hypothetical protein LBT50_09395 [Prevotellaceae bacterium]|jgi:hypothetical protein|nr:hypothetical protein [Prevotellaceae bacterium]
MNKNKIISDSQLRKTFKESSLENLSSGFMENLMAKIEKEAIRKRRKYVWITSLQIAAGISAMFLLPALVIRLCKIPVPEFSFSFPKIDVNFDPNIVIIGLAVLMLLIIDTLYSKHLFHTRFEKKDEVTKQ